MSLLRHNISKLPSNPLTSQQGPLFPVHPSSQPLTLACSLCSSEIVTCSRHSLVHSTPFSRGFDACNQSIPSHGFADVFRFLLAGGYYACDPIHVRFLHDVHGSVDGHPRYGLHEHLHDVLPSVDVVVVQHDAVQRWLFFLPSFVHLLVHVFSRQDGCRSV